MNRVKAVFLDRDGTINYERNYVHKIEDFELIPGTLEGLSLLTDNNIKIIIYTITKYNNCWTNIISRPWI